MEDDRTAGPNVPHGLSHHRCWIRLELKNVTADDGVKRAVECHLGRVALTEPDIPQRQSIRSLRSCFDRSRRPVYAEHSAGLTNQLRREERNVAGPTADIEHTHTWTDAAVTEEPSCNRADKTCLHTQTLKPSMGVPENVSMLRAVVGHIVQAAHGVSLPFRASPPDGLRPISLADHSRLSPFETRWPLAKRALRSSADTGWRRLSDRGFASRPAVHQLEDPRRGHGCLGHADIEGRQRILKCVRDCCSRSNGSAFTDALDAERVERRRTFEMNRDNGREASRRRQGVVQEAAGQQLALVRVHELLEQSTTDSLHHATVDLALDDQRIDDPPAIVSDHVLQQLHESGFDVHFDFGHMYGV